MPSSVILPPDLTNRTTAVNVMLSAIGEAPITEIDDNQSVDAANADGILRELTRAVQSKGWAWNREEKLVLTPDEDEIIALPTNCLYVGRAYLDPSGNIQAKVVERGRKLYDRLAQTFQFAAPVYCDLVLLLDWEDIPEYARHYITIAAARQFQGRFLGNALVNRITEQEELGALAVLDQRDDEAERLNQVYGNVDTVRRLHGNVRRRP